MKNGQAKPGLLLSDGPFYSWREKLTSSATNATSHHPEPQPCTVRSNLLYMDRIAMLSEILSQNPTDAFARYGLAMEYSKSGEVERALQEFAQLLASHPDYTAAYHMAAQTLVSARRIDVTRAAVSRLSR